MSESETISCKPTKWFLWRAVAMLAMFLFLGAWFWRDGKVGYPKKNVTFYTFKAFEEAEAEFVEREEAGQTAAEWQAFVSEQHIPFPEGKGVIPAEMDPQQPWPEVLHDYVGYKDAFEKDGGGVVPVLWSDYSDAQGWDERPKSGHDTDSIRNQFLSAGVAGVFALIALVILLRCMSREMKVDGEAYYPPGGPRIPFDKIRRIDKRKWETKGLATLFYEAEGGEEAKAKVDGMVYGQFEPENGAPAQALFDRILSNFSGELVELEREETPSSGAGGSEVEQG